MKLIHIRVPGRNSAAKLEEIRRMYIAGTLDAHGALIAELNIDQSGKYLIGARYAHPNKKADSIIGVIANIAESEFKAALQAGKDEAVLVTDAQFVVVVANLQGNTVSSDHRDAQVRANASIFDASMWEVNTFWRLKSWCRPHLAIYDYSGQDGRLVWSWVFHFGPFWIIRKRYAL